jgi:hypothetical protein
LEEAERARKAAAKAEAERKRKVVRLIFPFY